MVRITRRGAIGAGASFAIASAFPAGVVQARMMPKRSIKPIVLGHRGAPAHRPEHTLGSYARAIADGADFVEPDLVTTKDGILIARHENNIAETTDVSARSEFAAKRTTKTIDGEAVTGWFAEDFTLAEIKRLRAKERLGGMRPESQAYDGVFQVVTFEEIIDFVAAEAATRGRTIGLIPEIKHGTFFASIGLPLEGRFLATLRAAAYLRQAPIIVQSFEIGNLKYLRGQIGEFPNVQLMQLVDPSAHAPADVAAAGSGPTSLEMLQPEGLAMVAGYADWISPYNRAIIPLDANGRLAAPSGLAGAAHHVGLLLGTWTFRPENHFLAADFHNDAGDAARNPQGSVAEIRRYLAEGVDGFFTDDPKLGREAVDGV